MRRGTPDGGIGSRRTGRTRAAVTAWLAGVGVGGLLLAAITAGANPPADGQVQPVATSPMDQPLQLIAAARQAYAGVNDYVCLFIKRERIGGQLQPDNLIEMKVRSRPFSVYLHWLAPRDSSVQEACYVAGRNDGMMRVHSTGLLGAVGFVSIAPTDPRALRSSRHPITDAGIGNLTERLAKRWEQERQWNRTQVRLAEYTYDQRPCTRVETFHPDNSGRQYAAYRSVVYFDRTTRLPIRIETYDWPRAGGQPGGDLIESYSYARLRLNVGLTDAAFNY